MSSKKFHKLAHPHKWIIFLLGGLCIFANFKLSGIKREDKILIAPPKDIVHFHFGYSEMLSDLYWIRVLQDFDYCGLEKTGTSFAPSGRKMGRDRTPECSRGWSYQMIDRITDLTPRNYTPHQVGALTLSVITDDIDGATDIFQKAMMNFPTDWVIHYQAAYHFLLELEEKDLAINILKTASQNGGPEFIPLLIARLHTDLGNSALAEHVLNQYLKKVENTPKVKERAEQKLKELKKKRE